MPLISVELALSRKKAARSFAARLPEQLPFAFDSFVILLDVTLEEEYLPADDHSLSGWTVGKLRV